MTTPRTCPSCGKAADPVDQFCSACGGGILDLPSLEELEQKLSEALSPTFLLVRRIGTGGMGSVFLAREPALKRSVAVKVLAPELAVDSNARARFEREAQAVAGLSHPNVVSIYSVGELEDGTPFFAMQYVGGRSMSARVREEGSLESEEARRVVGEVASALEAAHRHDIIHRDIKPSNILFDDESGRVLVTDFGIAAVHPKSEMQQLTKLTQTGLAVGTPEYMSPEQLLAEDVTEQSDIYALGLVGYELLTGNAPFRSSSPQELIASHLRDTPRKISELQRDVDPELESVIEACLAKKPDDRPTAAEIAKRLVPGAGVLLEWPPPGLDPLHGRLAKLTTLIGTGSFLGVLSCILLIATGTAASSIFTSPWTFVLGLCALLGTVFLLLGVRSAIWVSRELVRALELGYGWRTVAEALVDSRGDTGELIAARREYAGLRPDARDVLRRGRLVTAVLAFAAVLAPVLFMGLGLALGSRGVTGAMGTVHLTWLPSALLVLAALFVGRREVRQVGRVRKKLGARARPLETIRRLVRPWHESFDAARVGQSLDAGAPGQPRAARWVGIGFAIGVVIVILLASPVILLGVFGPAAWQGARPLPSPWSARVREAQIGQRYRYPVDHTITPLDAGVALVTLSSVGRPEQPPPGTRRQRPPQDAQRPSPRRIERRWLPSDRNPFNPEAIESPEVVSLVRRADRGFSDEEAEFLGRVAAHPAFDEYRTVARAPAIDWMAASFGIPFPDTLLFMDVWSFRYEAVRRASYAHIAKAALELSNGRRQEAEATIREVISFGLTLMEQDVNPVGNRVGSIIVAYGLDALEELYSATGQTSEARQLRTARDSVDRASSEEEVREAQASSSRATQFALDVRRELIDVVKDTTELRGTRWGELSTLAIAPCTNIRELIFGPDNRLEALLDYAREDLVRMPSEEALIELLSETPQRMGYFLDRLEGREYLPSRIFYSIGRVTGALLGNERIAGCSAMLPNWVELF